MRAFAKWTFITTGLIVLAGYALDFSPPPVDPQTALAGMFKRDLASPSKRPYALATMEACSDKLGEAVTPRTLLNCYAAGTGRVYR